MCDHDQSKDSCSYSGWPWPSSSSSGRFKNRADYHGSSDITAMKTQIDMGSALVDQGLLDDAEACYRRELALAPDDPLIHSRLGQVHFGKSEYDEALKCYKRALQLFPESPDVLMNFSNLLLSTGHYPEGWECYAARFQANQGIKGRDFTYREWSGEPLDGKAILLWGEQGIGDEILFANQIREVMAAASLCVIECNAKLVPLFERSFRAARVVPATAPAHPTTLGPFDFQCAFGNLPRWLRPSLSSYPMHHGYLSADPNRIAYWRSRLLSLGKGLKIGFTWRSSNLTGNRHLYCTALGQWGPIFSFPHAHFINLQYDECATEIDEARCRFGVTLHRFSEVDLLNDLDEAAALTKAVDLVISAPTASGFLAGALGVPTWLLDYGNKWQTLGSDHFPWFPSVRRFARRWNQPWDETIIELADSLGKYPASI